MARTRIAPSPTGFPHMGTIYQALFNKAYAVKTNGSFIWRLEDTDQKRYVEGAVESLQRALEWFDLLPDESVLVGGKYGPYKQSERLNIYKQYAEKLVNAGHAYYCFCTSERLEKVRKEKQKNKEIPMYDKHCRHLTDEEVQGNLSKGKPYVIRMKIPENQPIVCHDLVRGDITFDSNLVDDQVIMKSDGFPTYHLAVVVDDHLMNITHIIRGAEWITSFPKHKLLYQYLGWQMPTVVHAPLLTNMDGSKLSKRHGHSSVAWYRKKGFLPEAILNFLALLGWSHPDGKEIFDFMEFVSHFELKDLSPVSPKFDLQKLTWMNGQYMKSLPNDIFVKKFIDWLDFNLSYTLEDITRFESDWIHDDYAKFKDFILGLSKDKQLLFAEINKERIKTFDDLLSLNTFFIKYIPVDVDLLNKFRSSVENKEHLSWVVGKLDSLNAWTLENLKDVEVEVKNRSEGLGWKIIEVFYPIRVAVCRSKVSPPLFESIYVLGKDRSMQRLREVVDMLGN